MATIIQAVEARDVAREHALRASLLVQLAKRRRWLAGLLLGACAAGLQLAALSIAPVAVVQPADAAGFLLLLAAGARVLDEPVGARQVAAICAIIAGVAMLAFADIVPADTHSGTGPLTTALGVTALVALAPFAARRLGRTLPWLMVIGAGAAFALAAFGLRLVADAIGSDAWASVVLFAAIAGSGSVLGLGSEMSAVQVRPIAAVAPVIFALEMLIPIVLARLVGGERWPGDPGNAALMTAGVLVTLVGATALLRSGPVVAVLSASERPSATAAGAAERERAPR